jgi:hypothetical protein
VPSGLIHSGTPAAAGQAAADWRHGSLGWLRNRAEAVRWALARIRERPAYAQLRERAREIERLKTEF